MYDIETGKKLERGGRPQRRQKNHATPCQKCPKKSPENERNVTLTHQNRRAFAAFLESRAVGAPESWKLDATFRRNCAIIGRIYEHWQASQNATDISMVLSQLLREKGG